jgi:hypothetical protein
MPLVEFEPTTPVIERAKTVYALNRAATVIGILLRLKNAKSESPPFLHSDPLRFRSETSKIEITYKKKANAISNDNCPHDND